MGKYELTLILDGKATAAKKKAVVEKIESYIQLLKGKIEKSEDWGKKDFSYKIGKSTTGIYLFFLINLEQSKVKDLNVKLKMENEILRYLLVRGM